MKGHHTATAASSQSESKTKTRSFVSGEDRRFLRMTDKGKGAKAHHTTTAAP